MSVSEKGALAAGTSLQGGRYVVERVLGQGGFGITYLCKHTGLGKRVAIKEFFFAQFCERQGDTSQVTVPTAGNRELVGKFRRKFVKEARLIADKLSQAPSVVNVFDVFDENGTSYYVMDYIDGRSLADVLKERGRLGEAEALAVIEQVGKALSYVHSRGINHLDIKPANIMVSRATGRAVLIDFGVAKQYDATTGEATTTTPVGRTPGYAPLEQYSLGGVSHFTPQSDIYALGATLYKLVTGNTPPEATAMPKDAVLPYPDDISTPVRQAITVAMQLHKEDRPTKVEDFLKLLHSQQKAGNKKIEPVDDKTDIDDKQPEVIEVDSGRSQKPQSISSLDSKPEHEQPRRKWLPWVVGAAVAAIAFVVVMLLQRGDKPQPAIDVPEELITAVTYGDTVAAVEQPVHQVVQQPQPTKPEPQRQQIQQPVEQLEFEPTPIPESTRSQNNLPEIAMVYVAGGTFLMGATSEQGSGAYDDEKPAHRMIINGYYIGKYEVTQKLWKAVMDNNPSNFKGDNLPVENVSWNDVQEFLRKLNAMTGKRYRLPTEAEWEFAARGGNNSRGHKYSGSDNIGSVAWYGNNSGNRTHVVGTKSSNELGIYDMSGNVREWCQDWYSSSYYGNSSRNNPTGPTSGASRVLRGGSWGLSARNCRVSYRGYSTPDDRYNYLGFRLALSPQ